MPFIKFKTNVEIKDKEKLKATLGRLIETMPGKSEKITMVEIEDRKDMYFGGSDEPCAMVQTLVNAGTDHSNDRGYTTAVIETIAKEFGLPKNRIYAIVQEQDFWFAIFK